MYIFEASIPNSFRDTSCYLKKSMSKNEVMSSFDDNMEEWEKGEEEESEFDDEYTYQVGYEVGYSKAREESLAMIAHLTLFCISLFILRWKIQLERSATILKRHDKR